MHGLTPGQSEREDFDASEDSYEPEKPVWEKPGKHEPFNLSTSDQSTNYGYPMFRQNGRTSKDLLYDIGKYYVSVIMVIFFFFFDMETSAQIAPSPHFDGSPSSSTAYLHSFEDSLSSAAEEQGVDMAYVDRKWVLAQCTIYRSPLQGKGILCADQQLMTGEETGIWVRAYASDVTMFRRDFALALMRLSNLRTLTAPMGQIHLNCSKTKINIYSLIDPSLRVELLILTEGWGTENSEFISMKNLSTISSYGFFAIFRNLPLLASSSFMGSFDVMIILFFFFFRASSSVDSGAIYARGVIRDHFTELGGRVCFEHGCWLINADWNCSVTHVFREGNKLADGLAHLGEVMEPGLLFSEEPPSAVGSLYDSDFRGLACLRSSPSLFFY
ncbi:hypothetical protein Dsin_013801 [Dipteronia sinensis]|uniref:Plant heme peroxidase family profile domain-containing protein n=1 Tax=Dipteronia sinensis TaxID=43782 RepID=A0AAE0E9C1_9ROSI|nr:hypothetical protein Dsin_013801 [Dipteronia sinensis]